MTEVDTHSGTRQLLDIMSEIDNQPEWRSISDKCHQYYDGNQTDPEVAQKKKARGQPNHVNNLIKPAINSMLGAEAKTRTDPIVLADNDEFENVAKALNVKLHEAARITDVDRATSDAYAGQLKGGIGWVEVNRTTDPFDYKYRVNTVHRSEITWDWNWERPDLKDARWLKRQRWFDYDHAELLFPGHKDLLGHAANEWSGYVNYDDEFHEHRDLVGAYSDYINHSDYRSHGDFFDTARKRVCVNELWYRKHVRKPVIKAGDIVAVFNMKNPIHQKLAMSGEAEISNAVFPVMRLAYFLGMHRIIDVPSPLPHNHFPYIPFWGYIEDGTKIPYAVIRDMLSPQDECNHRRSKATRELNRFRLRIDDDALHKMSPQQALEEEHRDDTVIRLNSNRKNANGYMVDRDQGIAAQQYQIMLQDEQMIQQVAGIYSAYSGQDSSATSGIAINSLVEQTTTSLGEINDNYRYARTQVHNLLLALIVDDLKDKQNYEVKVVDKTTKRTQVVVLNVPNEYGLVDNDVVSTKAKVVLGEINTSVGYKQQVSQQLMEIIQTLPDDLKAPLLHYWILTTDHPMKEEIADEIRKMLGQGQDPESMTPEEQEAFADEQAKAAQKAQFIEQFESEMMRLQLAEAKAKVDNLNGKTQKDSGDASLTAAKQEEIETKSLVNRAKAKETAHDIVAKRKGLVDQNIETHVY